MSSKLVTAPYLRAAFKGRNLSVEPQANSLDAVNKSILRELVEDNIDTALIRREIEELQDAHHFIPVTCRHRLLHFLHSLPVEIVLIVLIAADVCIVLSSMIIDIFIDQETLLESRHTSEDFLHYLTMLNSMHGCVSLHSSVAASLGDVNIAHEAIQTILADSPYLIAGAGNVSQHRRKRASGSSEFTEGSLGQRLETASHVLHYVAMAILAILVLEVLLKIGAHGRQIWRYKIGIVDGIVNTASLVIDIFITGSSGIGAIGKVLVILTLIWQVFRILNAIVITSQARAELRIRLLKKTKAMHEEKLDEMTKQMARSKSEVERLRRVADLYKVPQYEIMALNHAVDGQTAKTGIRNSLFQILRFSDAMQRQASVNQHQPATVTAVQPQLYASLPDFTSADGLPSPKTNDMHALGTEAEVSAEAAHTIGVDAAASAATMNAEQTRHHPITAENVAPPTPDSISGHPTRHVDEIMPAKLLSGFKHTWPRAACRKIGPWRPNGAGGLPAHYRPALWYVHSDNESKRPLDRVDSGGILAGSMRPASDADKTEGPVKLTKLLRISDRRNTVGILQLSDISMDTELTPVRSPVKAVTIGMTHPVSASSDSNSVAAPVSGSSTTPTPVSETCCSVDDGGCYTQAKILRGKDKCEAANAGLADLRSLESLHRLPITVASDSGDQ